MSEVCPGCGFNKWIGPQYRTHYVGTTSSTDYLSYTCERCGYERREMTHRQKQEYTPMVNFRIPPTVPGKNTRTDE